MILALLACAPHLPGALPHGTDRDPFGAAMLALQPDKARAAATTDERRSLVDALAGLRGDAASSALERLSASKDPMVSMFAGDYLVAVHKQRGDYAEVARRVPAADAPPFVSLGALPPMTVMLPDQPFTLDLQPSAASPLLVATVDVGGQPCRFILDTGADVTVIDDDVATRLGLGGAKVAVQTSTHEASLELVSIPTLSLGGIVARSVPAVVRDLSGLVVPGSTGPAVDGVLPWSILGRTAWTVDPEAHTITFAPSVASNATGNLFSLDELYLRAALADGRTLVFHVDTGATTTELFDDGARRLGFHVGAVATAPVEGVAGTRQRAYHVVTDPISLQVGGLSLDLQGVPTSDERLANPPAVIDGRIGIDILGAAKLTVDGPAGTLTFAD
jgi:predicted aspartyl protease